MRTLGVDLGSRRVGLALSDGEGRLATPYRVLEVGSAAQALAEVSRVARDEAVGRIVLGLPLNMDDTFGPAARQTLAWGRQLAKATGLQVIYVDERLSSFQAEQQLIGRKRAGEKLTRARKKRQLDALSAAGFLQEYLDGKLAALEVGEEQ